MFKELRKLVKHSGIYTFGNFTSKILGILLIPLYTKVIDVNVFGIYSILEVTLQFMVGILHLGLPLALLRWLNLEDNKERSGIILFSVFISTLFIAIAVFIAMFGLKSTISELLFGSTKYTDCLLLISLIAGINLLNNIGLTYLRSEEKSVLFISVSIVRFFIQLIITIYLVAFLKVGIIGIFGGQLSGSIIGSLFLFPMMMKRFTIRINIREIKEMLSFGYPLAFEGISNRILNMGDRYILGYLTNWSIVGIYSLGYKFANLIDTMFIKSFRYAFLPLAWKKLNDDNAERYYAKMLTYFVFFIFWLTLFISVFSKGIIHIFARDKSYWDAYIIVPIAVFAISIKGMFSVVKMGLQFKSKTTYIALIVASAAVFNVVLNFILIPFFGMMGAAVATLLSFVCIVIAGYYYSNKFYPIKFEWYRIAKIITVICGMYGVSFIFNPLPIIPRIIVKFIFILLYPLILYMFKFYYASELSRIKGGWRKWSNIKNWKKNLKNIKLN